MALKVLIIFIIFSSIILTGCGYHNDYNIYNNITHSQCQVKCADLGQSRICSSFSVSYDTLNEECECVFFECLKPCKECLT